MKPGELESQPQRLDGERQSFRGHRTGVDFTAGPRAIRRGAEHAAAPTGWGWGAGAKGEGLQQWQSAGGAGPLRPALCGQSHGKDGGERRREWDPSASQDSGGRWPFSVPCAAAPRPSCFSPLSVSCRVDVARSESGWFLGNPGEPERTGAVIGERSTRVILSRCLWTRVFITCVHECSPDGIPNIKSYAHEQTSTQVCAGQRVTLTSQRQTQHRKDWGWHGSHSPRMRHKQDPGPPEGLLKASG